MSKLKQISEWLKNVFNGPKECGNIKPNSVYIEPFYKRYLTIKQYRIEFAKELLSKGIKHCILVNHEHKENKYFAVNILKEYVEYLLVVGSTQEDINYYLKMIEDFENRKITQQEILDIINPKESKKPYHGIKPPSTNQTKYN